MILLQRDLLKTIVQSQIACHYVWKNYLIITLPHCRLARSISTIGLVTEIYRSFHFRSFCYQTKAKLLALKQKNHIFAANIRRFQVNKAFPAHLFTVRHVIFIVTLLTTKHRRRFSEGFRTQISMGLPSLAHKSTLVSRLFVCVTMREKNLWSGAMFSFKEPYYLR